MRIALLILASSVAFGQALPFPGPGGVVAASAGIAFDSSADGGLVVTGTSLTWSHTVSGSNTILWVGAFGDSLSTDPTCAKVTGVTYNSVSMAQVSSSPYGVIGDRCLYLFYLAGPSSGTHSVVVNASTSIVIGGMSSSYTGAKQTGIPDAQNTNLTAGTSFNNTVTVVANGSWVVMTTKNNTGDLTTGTSQTTVRQTTASGNSFGDSNAPASPGGYTMQITTSGVNTLGSIAASFAPN